MRSLLALDPTAIASKLPAGLLSPMAAVFQTAANSQVSMVSLRFQLDVAGIFRLHLVITS
jgi:hypothetical protein